MNGSARDARFLQHGSERADVLQVLVDRRPARLLGALLVALLTVLTLSTLSGTATAATVPVPASPAGLPTGIEALAPYVPQDSCDYTVKPGLLAFQRMVNATYPDTGSYGFISTCAAEGMTSEHSDGRAWDWAASVTNAKQNSEVNALLTWLLAKDKAGNTAAMARRLGIMYIIWNKQIWGAYSAGSGWRPYSCSGVTGCHQDHVHFSFAWNGAMKRTSFWTKSVAPVDYGPCVPFGLTYARPYAGFNPNRCPTNPTPPAGTPLAGLLRFYASASLRVGDTGPAVSVLQRAVGLTGSAVDGDFGNQTLTKLQAFERTHGLAVGTTVTGPVWAALLAAITAPPPPPAPKPARLSWGRKTTTVAPAPSSWGGTSRSRSESDTPGLTAGD